MKLIINLNEIKDISSETCLVGFKHGLEFSKLFDVLDHEKVHFIIPYNIITINTSFLVGFFNDLSRDPAKLNDISFSNDKINQKLKDIQKRWEIDHLAYQYSLEDSDLSSLAHFFRQFRILDNKMIRQGYITKTDIYKTDLPTWVKSVFIFISKRSSDYKFYYILDNKRYESKYDIPKNDRLKAEIYFVSNMD